MFKRISLGYIAILLALSGFNGYAYLTQIYPNCEISILSESETVSEPSEDATESESGGIGGLIGGLMPGGGGEGGGGIGGLIGGGGGLPGLPGGWIIPYAFGQSEIEETSEEKSTDQSHTQINPTVNSICDMPRMIQMGTLGLGLAGIAGLVYVYVLPIIRKKKLGSGDFGNDVNIIIETGQGKIGVPLNIIVKLKGKKNKPLYQTNYDVTANQGNEVILEDLDVHSQNGELSHSTIELPFELNKTNPITIQVIFKGFGIKPPFSGPIGENSIKTIAGEVEKPEERKKISITKLNLKIIIPIIIATVFPLVMMSGVIPIQADETISTITEIEEPQVTIAELENKIDVLELHVQNIADSINLEVPGKQGEKGPIGNRGIKGEPGIDGGPGERFSILSFSSGDKKIRVSGTMYLGENESFPNYHSAKTFIPFNGDLKNLVVLMDNAPSILVSVTLMKNDIPTNLSCKLEKNTQCIDTENTVPIEIGDTISLRLNENEHGESDSFIVQASMVIEIP